MCYIIAASERLHKLKREAAVMRKYKVIVWGLGNVGRVAIRMIMEKKSLELVGAIDVDPNKVGKDAGEIFGFGKTGVTVTDDVDKVFALDADVILDYMPFVRDEHGEGDRINCKAKSATDICRALRAKKNVITTIPITYCKERKPELYKMINDCAKENGVTYLPYGLLPGAYASYIPMVLSSIVGRVDKITVQSGEDDQHNTSGWVSVFGYGKLPKDHPCEWLKDDIISYYGSAVSEMGERLGFQFDDIKNTHEVVTSPVDMHTDFCAINKGTIFAHVFTMSGFVKGEEKVTLRYVHKVCDNIVSNPPITNMIQIDGLPSLHMELEGMIPMEESFVTSAAPTISAIPATVEAGPGWKQAMDLGTIIPVL